MKSSAQIQTSDAMANPPSTETPKSFFKLNALVLGIRPSQILKLWGEFRGQMFGDRGIDVICLDPAFHPATHDELAAWIRYELERIVEKRKEIEAGGNTNQVTLLDCDDSAFQLKSAASGLIRTRLSAPLCVGVLACRVKATGREHMVNWVVSAEPDRQSAPKDGNNESPRKPGPPELKLWIVDVHALINEALQNPNNALPATLLRPLAECANVYSDISFILI